MVSRRRAAGFGLVVRLWGPTCGGEGKVCAFVSIAMMLWWVCWYGMRVSVRAVHHVSCSWAVCALVGACADVVVKLAKGRCKVMVSCVGVEYFGKPYLATIVALVVSAGGNDNEVLARVEPSGGPGLLQAYGKGDLAVVLVDVFL
eukprot:3666899-Alexandrium_andersonii.AAC.1